jgi:putative SOS response-associated peptidase YedK
MCGRFTLTVPTFDELASALGVSMVRPEGVDYAPRFNVAPSQHAWVLTSGPVGPELRLSRWGFDARSSAEEPPRRPVLNAPTYTLGGSASFRLAMRDGRVIVIADGFFEWVSSKEDRRPFWFRPAEGRLLHMAAVEAKVDQPTFAIVTTEASQDVRDVHARMPLLFDRESALRWLAGESLRDLERAPIALRRTRVGVRVNDVRNDDETCVTEASSEPSVGQTLDLFGDAVQPTATRRRR